MTTSPYSKLVLAWRIYRYLTIRGFAGILRLTSWVVVRSVQFLVGVLALVASPASSGRAQDEFKDLVQTDLPDNPARPGTVDDGFWRMYLQAYSPRLWRMRKLLPASAGMRSKKEPPKDQE